MATHKEKLQAQAEEMGLDTDGTIPQLKAAIAAAEAEDGGLGDSNVEATPTEEAVNEVNVETAERFDGAPVEAAEELPDTPVNPVVKAPAPRPQGSSQTYEVLSSFYLHTKSGSEIASTGGQVTLTDKQALRYLHAGVIKLVA